MRGNRETVGGELLITYDPTPATWMWAWDNDLREDARLAASLGFVFRHHAHHQDATICFLGRTALTVFAWIAACRRPTSGRPEPAIWSRLRSPDLRLSWPSSTAATRRPTARTRASPTATAATRGLAWRSFAFSGFARFNDWGPYDYYRDFNLHASRCS